MELRQVHNTNSCLNVICLTMTSEELVIFYTWPKVIFPYLMWPRSDKSLDIHGLCLQGSCFSKAHSREWQAFKFTKKSLHRILTILMSFMSVHLFVSSRARRDLPTDVICLKSAYIWLSPNFSKLKLYSCSSKCQNCIYLTYIYSKFQLQYFYPTWIN